MRTTEFMYCECIDCNCENYVGYYEDDVDYLRLCQDCEFGEHKEEKWNV